MIGNDGDCLRASLTGSLDVSWGVGVSNMAFSVPFLSPFSFPTISAPKPDGLYLSSTHAKPCSDWLWATFLHFCLSPPTPLHLTIHTVAAYQYKANDFFSVMGAQSHALVHFPPYSKSEGKDGKPGKQKVAIRKGIIDSIYTNILSSEC